MQTSEIVIRPAVDGKYKTAFPYKPSAGAIRGFHGIGMVWRKNESGVVWYIPSGKLAEALEFIGYWYGEKAEPGRVPCTVRIEEAASGLLVAGMDQLQAQEAA